MLRYILLIIVFSFVFVEAYFLNIISGLMGVFFTLILTILSGVLGFALAKRQGLSALAGVRDITNLQRIRLTGLFDGFGIMVAAILLILPGFVTDFLGLLIFIVPMRQAIIRLISKMLTRDFSHDYHDREFTDNEVNGGPIIDGQFSTVSSSADKKAKSNKGPN
jgi:UPF0716 protein FxsA